MLKQLLPKDWQPMYDKLNKWFEDNIKKINENTPPQLKEGYKSRRPLPPVNTATNIRGVTRVAKDGQKLI
jgi:hypothetical protein